MRSGYTALNPLCAPPLHPCTFLTLPLTVVGAEDLQFKHHLVIDFGDDCLLDCLIPDEWVVLAADFDVAVAVDGAVAELEALGVAVVLEQGAAVLAVPVAVVVVVAVVTAVAVVVLARKALEK